MRLIYGLLIAMALGGCASTPPAPPAAPAPLTAADHAEISLAVERGERLYRHDRWAWIASDFLARAGLSAGVGGRLIRELQSGGGEVIWVHHDQPRVVAEVEIPAGVDLQACANAGSLGQSCQGVVIRPVERELSDDEQNQYRAFQLLRQSKVQVCADAPANFALFREGPVWLGYVLSATRDPAKRIMSGHTRLQIDASGSTLLQVEPMFRSCMVTAADPGMVAFTSSSLTTRVINEGHVFTALTYATPFYVIGTARRTIAIQPNGERATAREL